MAKKKATINLATSGVLAKEPSLTWDTAIKDAEAKITAAQRYIAGLQESIRTFQELKEDGEPFPIEVSKTKGRAKAA